MAVRSTAIGILLAVSFAHSAPAATSFADAEAAYKRGDYREAADLFARYRDSHSRDIWGPYMEGLSLWKSGRAEDATVALCAALDLDPDHVKSLINLGRVHLDLEDAANALPLLERAVELAPESVVARRVLARAQHSLDDREAARSTYLEALEIDSEDPWSLNNYGLILIEQEEFAAAVAPLAKACLLKPEEACLRNNLGIALERSGRIGPAAIAYTNAITNDEDYAKARISLARVQELARERAAAGPEAAPSLEELASGFSPAPRAEPAGADVAVVTPATPTEEEPAPGAEGPAADESAARAGDVAADGQGTAESREAADTEAEKETSSQKKRSSKKKKRKRKSRAPDVQFSGKFALRVIYDDNIIHYSDEDLHEFETDPTPGKFLIETAGDWIVRPRLDLVAKSKVLTGKKLEALLRLSGWRYVTNGVKDNESIYVRLKHPGFGKDNFQATFYHAPQSYLRNFKDRGPDVPKSTPMVSTQFRYTSTSAGLAYWRRLSKRLDGKFEVKRSWRYYNQPFMENDNWEWKFGGYLTYKLAKRLKMTAEYFYSDVAARGADEIDETLETSNDGDASYERDSYRLVLTVSVPQSFLKVKSISLKGQYQAYYFTSTKPPEKDRYHVGRKDEIRRLEVTWNTRKVFRSVRLEGGYRFTVRDSSAPWETGEGESIDEDKDYTDNRVWVGMEYGF